MPYLSKKDRQIETYRAIRKNPKKGFKILYERYAIPLYNYAIQSWHMDEDDAWDIIYKVLFKITDHITTYKFRDEGQFKNMLYTIFKNELINYYRKTKRIEERLKLMQLDESEFKDSEEMFRTALQEFYEIPDSENSLLNALNALLNELQDWERILVVQRANGMSYREISLFIEKPEEQLKVYYKRIKEKLHKELIKLEETKKNG